MIIDVLIFFRNTYFTKPSEGIFPARTENERRKALNLTSKIYREEGYLSGTEENSDFEKYILEPSTKVFIASKNNKVFGTVSIVTDSEKLGLPMDSLYKKEVDEIRKLGGKIAEVTQLALEKETDDKTKSLSTLSLFKLVIQYAKYKSIDYLCIAINPKHDTFYKRVGFKELGELKYYPSVNNAPALARILDFKDFLSRDDLPKIFMNMKNEETNTLLMK